jgi:BirA family biotin operon repressor/biotin-[acetyl-CoA-carboxylase] ligase
VIEDSLNKRLDEISIGPLRYFDSIGSTNEEATRWAGEGAPHLSLVVSDEQTAGRGRLGRHWFTPAGSALAFSLVLRPEFLPFLQNESHIALTRLTALGTVAVCAALLHSYDLVTQIKWPNDVLLAGQKTSGVLVEADWQGEQLQAVILGIGINIAKGSVPPAQEILFPATCVEAVLGRPVDRYDLLIAVLQQLLSWLPRLSSAEFISYWEDHLAFRGEQVQIFNDSDLLIEGQLMGLDTQGALRLLTLDGQVMTLQTGEIHLRPLTG